LIIKSRPLEINKANPFENDALNRKVCADSLTEFVLSADDSIVICLDAPWGQGKSTFLMMWEQTLKNNNIPTIYFNAWESDFSDDALICFLGEISAAVNEISKSGDTPKAIDYLGRAKSVSVALMKRSIPVAAKIATAGALDLDSLTEQALSGLAESFAKDELEKYDKSKQSLKEFRKALTELAKSITDIANPRPLIFIIDELDRCRPNFSVELLEKAKHFFNVPNIVFVLGADKQQLGSSIKAIYGEGLNVDGYLRRFIDFDYILPPAKTDTFITSLFSKYGFNDYFRGKNGSDLSYEGDQALTKLSDLSALYRLTLREQEHCCSLLSIAIKTTPSDQQLHPIFLCFLIVLKIKAFDLYHALVTDDLTLDDVLHRFEETPGAKEILGRSYGVALEAYLAVSKGCAEIPITLLNKYREAENDASTDPDKDRARRVYKIIKSLGWRGGAGILDYLLKKIELASRFKA
jgi:hypothetical protein